MGFSEIALIMMTYFIIKHFICDFPIDIQTPWMFQNKGTYGHPGGIAHSAIHVAASAPLLMWMCSISAYYPIPDWVRLIACLSLEFTVHYHMDWFKMWWCAKRQYRPDTHSEFWLWLGIDQMVHYLTYVIIIAMWIL